MENIKGLKDTKGLEGVEETEDREGVEDVEDPYPGFAEGGQEVGAVETAKRLEQERSEAEKSAALRDELLAEKDRAVAAVSAASAGTIEGLEAKLAQAEQAMQADLEAGVAAAAAADSAAAAAACKTAAVVAAAQQVETQLEETEARLAREVASLEAAKKQAEAERDSAWETSLSRVQVRHWCSGR